MTLGDILAGEGLPDPEAFVALFRAAAGSIPGADKILPPVFRDSTLQDSIHHPLRLALDGLEHHRANVWQPGVGRNRAQVATGLVAVMAASRLDAELETADWAGEAEKVLHARKLIVELWGIAAEFGDKQSLDLLLALYERFDVQFPDEDRLVRQENRRDRPSRNKAGLRERLMALTLHRYLEMALGFRNPNLIAQLLWEAAGLEINAKQVGRWISAYARKSF